MEKVLIAVMLVIFALVAISVVNDYVDCKDSGGSYVKGVFWYECVESAR